MTEIKVLALKQEGLNTAQDVLAYMGQQLEAMGAVRPSFISAIQEREETFATGLQVHDYGVAMPHTDSDHVKKSTIAFMTLDQPVIFKQMGDGQEVPVSLVAMLALADAHSHLEMLQALMMLFQDQDLVKEAMAYSDSPENRDKVLKLVHKIIK